MASDDFQNAPGSNPGIPAHERSGSHPRSPAYGPAPPPQPQQDWLAMNARPIIFALIGALTGTMGVGGFTFAAASHDAVVATAPEVTIAFADVNAKLATITVTLAEMKTQLAASSREDNKRDEQLGDHETRLRKLEERLRAR